MRSPYLLLPAKQWQETKFEDIKDLIDPYIKKMTGRVSAGQWGWQRLFAGADNVDFEYVKRKIKPSDWTDHLAGFPRQHVAWNPKTKKKEKYMRGALGFRGEFSDGICKWFCIDVDSEKSVGLIRARYAPYLKDEYGIETLWEFGGRDFDRGKLWMFCEEIELPLLKQFHIRTWEESGCLDETRYAIHAKEEKYELEFYPTLKPKNLLRFPPGPHMRANQIMPVMASYDTKESETVQQILQKIIEMPAYSPEFIEKIVKARSKGVTQSFLYASHTPNEHKGSPRANRKKMVLDYPDLGVPIDGMTEYGNVLASRCPAIHKILSMIKDGFLNESGEEVHKAGLYVSGLFSQSKIAMRSTYTDMVEDVDGHIDDMRDEFFSTYRTDRPEDSHHWRGEYSASCETWETTFSQYDPCKGCKLRRVEGFTHPNQLYYAKKLKPKETYKAKELLSMEEIAKRVRFELKKGILTSLRRELKSVISVQSAQGSQKSRSADHILSMVSQQGFLSLLCVPSGQLAIEHGARLVAKGVNVLYLMSWESTFEYLDLPFECPSAVEIEPLSRRGILDASEIRRRYCGKCSYKNECPFFNEWKRLEDQDFEVAIMQHAHLQSSVSLARINRVQFDLLIIDEDFRTATRSYFRITTAERRIINSFAEKYEWMKDIAYWLHGHDAELKNIPAVQMEHVANEFLKQDVQFRIKEILRIMKSGVRYNKHTGVVVPNRMPLIPIKVNLDATASEADIQQVFKTKNLTVIGKEWLCDPVLQHPNNEVIQVMDKSSSVVSHKNKRRFYREIDYDCYRIRTEPWIAKALITVFKSEIKEVRSYIKENHPDVFDRIEVSYMKTGVNEWSHFDAQFLHASVHPGRKTLLLEKWIDKEIRNETSEEEPTFDIFPAYTSNGDGYGAIVLPVRTFLRGDSGVALLTKFPQVVRKFPSLVENGEIVTRAEGKTQQAIRARFLPGARRLVIVYSYFRFYGFAFTAAKMWKDLEGELARWELDNRYRPRDEEKSLYEEFEESDDFLDD